MKTLFIKRITYYLQAKHMNLIKIIIDKYKELSFWEYSCVICKMPQMKKSYDIIKGTLSYKNSITSKESAMYDPVQELAEILVWFYFEDQWPEFLNYFR